MGRGEYVCLVQKIQKLERAMSVKNLPVGQLKALLLQYGVDISGCIERSDLESRLTEYQQRSAVAPSNDAEICDVCGEEEGELLLCDGGMLQGIECHYAAHPSCVGVNLADLKDDEEWFCMKCVAAKARAGAT